mmetsp:Transcript_94854/g.267973  ORF Transcript_94854/g.267973 Transcript_94854/m.267973 type:complete len:417 (+) Transcript_94854:127-1377(+)
MRLTAGACPGSGAAATVSLGALLAISVALWPRRTAENKWVEQQGGAFLLPTSTSRDVIQQVQRPGVAGRVGLVFGSAPTKDVSSPLQPSPLAFFMAMAGAAAALSRARVTRKAWAKGAPQSTSGIRYRTPLGNHLRNASIATFEECTERRRYEPLVFKFGRRYARAKGGHIQMAARRSRCSGHHSTGLGLSFTRHARRYRVIDFGRTKRGIFGTIETIEYDPFRNARICLVKYEDGEKRYILHGLGYFVGQQVISDEQAPVFVGNAMPLSAVTIGTQVHNIEMQPGKGGALQRAAGAAATVLSKDYETVTVKLQSTEVRLLKKDCWCTIGRVGRTEANMIDKGKAGKRYQLGWRPRVHGKAKNACDHPHGGGEGHSPIGHNYPMNPFGQCIFKRTRNPKKKSSKMILIRTKRKSEL